LRRDLSTDVIAQLLIHDTTYLKLHPDVQQANMGAFTHYLNAGFSENRQSGVLSIHPENKKDKTSDEAQKHCYIFMEAGEENASCKYRCLFPAMRSGDAVITSDWTLEKILLQLFSCSSVTFLRPQISHEKTLYLLTLCKNLGLDISIDQDDLLFPDIVHTKGAVRSHIIKNIITTLSQKTNDSAALLWADRLQCSTPAIARWFDYMDRPVQIIPNKLPLTYFGKGQIFDRHDGKLKILYPAGTQTHFRDFSLISGILLRLFQEHPNAFELTLLGHAPNWKFSHILGIKNLHIIDKVPFDEMLKIYSEHDIILVPLEKTSFNDAKSAIKYIEAASQSIPIIATPTAEFARKITDGVNGFLCDDDESWYRILKNLISDKSILPEIGRNAYHQARKEDCIHV